ncbi:MAG: hypothetical protein M1454_01010 [Candidatus Thermoplasmatota archaeon]|nr:hypothetical protein [Candidatus Thermoplasmatota archaeon]MCL5730589.1 hypothetical protein [Candidatus Thermoplasmatota archaeon]
MNFINENDQEIKDILVAVAILTAAFLIVDLSYYGRATLLAYFGIFLTAALVSVLSAFLMHELSHRYVARRFGQYAYFKLWPMGAMLALITSVFGIIFAAPGAVYYHGYLSDSRTNGIISAAGPGMNIALGTIFAVLGTISGEFIFSTILIEAARLNFWFGFFNMIPFWQLDGAKVFHWNNEIFLLMIAAALLGTVLTGFF